MANDKKKSAFEKAQEMLAQDYQQSNDTYQQDQGVVDAANQAFHSAGNMQRQTTQQMRDEEFKKIKAKALAKKKQEQMNQDQSE